jgi:hypothetical protein
MTTTNDTRPNYIIYAEYMHAIEDRSLAFKACEASGTRLWSDPFFVEANARLARLAAEWQDYLNSIGQNE